MDINLIQRKLFNLYTMWDVIRLTYHSKCSPKKMEKIHQKNLKKMVHNAYKIPFYKERFDKAGVKPEDIKTDADLLKLPLLTKHEFRMWMTEEVKKTENENCMKSHTSGSTGVPMTILFTPREYATDVANIIRAWFVSGYNAFTGKTLTRISDHSESIGYKTLIQRMGILRREYVKQFDPEEDIIEIINTYKPNLLQMNKSELMRLAVYSKNNDVKINKPDFYMPLGENVDDISLKTLEEIYGEGLISCYGCAEMGTVCTRIPGRSDFLIYDDMFTVNMYDDNDNLTNEGRIVLTTLYRDKFPLINYDVGDRGIFENIDGRNYLVKIQGRQDDVLRFRNGGKTAYTSLWPVVAQCEDILQIRFIQESYDDVTLQIVQCGDSEKSHKEIEEFLTPKLQQKCADEIRFAYEWLNVIPPDPNGKIRMIVSKIKE